MADGNSPKNRIRFYSHGVAFTLQERPAVEKLILTLIRKEKKKAGDINYIFCNDKFLLGLNKKFLKHNTFTDIITFQYPATELSGEIYISIPRVKENAKKFSNSPENELMRVIIHGALHLCGYQDKSPVKKNKMRRKEDIYLALFKK